MSNAPILKDEVDLFSLIKQIASEDNIQVYLIGGIVRDWLLGNRSLQNDCDLVLEGDILSFSAKLARALKAKHTFFKRFLTAKLILPNSIGRIKEIDLVRTRKESYEYPGALPLVQEGSFKDDLSRRDFTINTLANKLKDYILVLKDSAYSFKERIIDKFNGIDDLNKGLIRVLHHKSFIDDPTRMLRAVRYKFRIGGDYEPGTAALLQNAIKDQSLSTISFQRAFNELKKIFIEPQAKYMLQELYNLKILDQLFPLNSHKNKDLLSAFNLSEIKDPVLFYSKVLYLSSDVKKRDDLFNKAGFKLKTLKLWRSNQ